MSEVPHLELVHLSPTADSSLRWADGALRGLKTFLWRRGEVLSPLHRTPWPGGKLTAENFFPSETVRGEGGIHAIWPPRGLEDAGLDEFEQYVPREAQAFSALVKGWGRCVMGDVGWRAEHCRIAAVVQPPRQGYVKFKRWCLDNGVKWSNL